MDILVDKDKEKKEKVHKDNVSSVSCATSRRQKTNVSLGYAQVWAMPK